MATQDTGVPWYTPVAVVNPREEVTIRTGTVASKFLTIFSNRPTEPTVIILSAISPGPIYL
jgi:hypothetical protein